MAVLEGRSMHSLYSDFSKALLVSTSPKASRQTNKATLATANLEDAPKVQLY